jgi:hypothetical protein
MRQDLSYILGIIKLAPAWFERIRNSCIACNTNADAPTKA